MCVHVCVCVYQIIEPSGFSYDQLTEMQRIKGASRTARVRLKNENIALGLRISVYQYHHVVATYPLLLICLFELKVSEYLKTGHASTRAIFTLGGRPWR